MRALRTALVVALAALGAAGAVLFAVSQAHVHGTVRDENGNPVPGVKIVVTSDQVATFRVENSTGDKGEFGITLLDATRVYTYTLEKEGYQTLSETFKVPIGSSDRHDFELLSVEEARRRGPTGRELTAAERAVLIFNEGAEASQMGDTSTARAKFEQAIELDPQLGAAYTALATLAFADGDHGRAVELAERARALDPNDLKCLRVLVESYGKLGDTAKAAEAATALAALDPKSGAVDLINQGIGAYNAGDSVGALDLLGKALAIDPENAKAHYMAGLCLVATDAAAARGHFETFLRLAPDDPDAATARDIMEYLQ